LRQELVDEGGLPVVDMGDDGDIAQLHWSFQSKAARLEPDRASCKRSRRGRSRQWNLLRCNIAKWARRQ
jgi:hypothetical protein